MTRRAVGGLAVVLVAGMIALGWLWMQGAMPLRGPDSHDFGLILIEHGEARAEAQLEFVNESNRAIVIDAVKGSCTCIAAVTNRREIEPAGRMQLDISLVVTESGLKQESVRLLVRDRGVFTIDVAARARKAQPLSIGMPDITLRPGKSVTTPLHAEVWPGESTEPPVVEAPEDLRVELTDWREVKPADERRSRPAIHAATITITAAADATPGTKAISCTLGAARPLLIPVVVSE